MKLTWFGGTTIRIHIGGKILVADPSDIEGVDRGELLAGAETTFSIAAPGPAVDPAGWRPRRPGTALDEQVLPEVLVHAVPGGALVDAVGEPPLLLAAGPVSAGRWGRDAVVVVFGKGAASAATQVLDAVGPRLIAIAAPEAVVDEAFSTLRDRLDGASLTSLEPGLAVEV